MTTWRPSAKEGNALVLEQFSLQLLCYRVLAHQCVSCTRMARLTERSYAPLAFSLFVLVGFISLLFWLDV
jgi:hypothetical protein